MSGFRVRDRVSGAPLRLLLRLARLVAHLVRVRGGVREKVGVGGGVGGGGGGGGGVRVRLRVRLRRGCAPARIHSRA